MSKNPSPDLDGIEPYTYQRRWKILAALCGTLLVVMLANSSLNLALPMLARDLQLSTLSLTWIVDIYSLLFASLLFTTGAVGDRYGRKRAMQIGLLIFTAAAAYAGLFADTGLKLIFARAVMGVGAALVMPTTLSIINNSFPRKERARAIAIWSGIAGGGMALGSILSGFLLEHYSWHSLFFFSSGLGIVSFSVNKALLHESRDEKQSPVDWLGGVLSTFGIFGIVYAIIEAPSHGLDEPAILGSLIAGIVSILAFIRWELKTKSPMLDVRLFKSLPFGISSLVLTMTFLAMMGVFFSMSQIMQLILGYSPMQSSLYMLPLMLPMMLFAPFVPRIVQRFGSRYTVAAGLLAGSVAFGLMSLWPVDLQYWQVVGSMLLLMFGISLAMTPGTNILMASVPRNRSGMGSAMNDVTRELGGTLGVAVLGAVISSVYSDKISGVASQLTGAAKAGVESSLAGALATAEQLGPMGQTVIVAAQTAFMDGVTNAMGIAALILLAMAVTAFIWLPHTHQPNDDVL